MMAPNRAAPTGLAVMPQLLQLFPAAKAITCCSASPINAPMTIAQKRFLMLDTQPLSAHFLQAQIGRKLSATRLTT